MHQVEDFFLLPNQEHDGSSLQKTMVNFCNEYLEQLALGDAPALGARVNELANAALRLFDGDKPLEVGGAPKDKPKQDWVIAMNLGTDFGNECSIEKRTKKLQELAADTKGKPVTIVVQYAVKDSEGKFKLERFALNDGKVVKLESPGRSGGYASDVEQLLKFTNQNYPSQNLGLILDSHGTGNGGMQSDVGNMSLTELRDSVTKALKNSGHEKLDLLQFNACLMAQNGVLESTQGIARHIVASAEPEGTGTQGRDFDNKVFTELLKKPSMSASELADVAIQNARDHAQDFPTLAHFDMEKYGKFRESLDTFGEKMAKLCEDPAQLEVIRGIIRETFSYGGGSFRLSNFFQHFGGKEKFDDKPHYSPHSSPDVKPDGSPDVKPSGRPNGNPDGGWLEQLFKPPLQASELGSLVGSGLRCESGRRDLKDFVARVLLAISKGQLKDPDGSLEKAAKALLIDGTALIKSFFGEGERRRNLGGLSTFLPAGAGDDGSADPVPSTNGGWREFQQVLRKSFEKSVGKQR